MKVNVIFVYWLSPFPFLFIVHVAFLLAVPLCVSVRKIGGVVELGYFQPVAADLGTHTLCTTVVHLHRVRKYMEMAGNLATAV